MLIENRDGHYGVLEVDDTREGMFEEADIAFMRGFANLLGGAIERIRAEARLNAALEQQDLLTREMSHRVKNSLAIVAGLLQLQARGADDPAVERALADAQARVVAIASVHDQLWRQPDVTTISLGDFLHALCARLHDSAGPHRPVCRALSVSFPADCAVPLGLFVNELVTNAIKYAYLDGAGDIRIEAREGNDSGLVISVSDDGIGLPRDSIRPSAARASACASSTTWCASSTAS